MENKESNNQIIVEAASEMLYSLLKSSRDQLPKEFKKQILEIFNGSVNKFLLSSHLIKEFFKCSRRTLKYWKEIIDWISDKEDLLLDQLGSN